MPLLGQNAKPQHVREGPASGSKKSRLHEGLLKAFAPNVGKLSCDGTEISLTAYIADVCASRAKRAKRSCMKAGIIGIGAVGRAAALAAMQRGSANELLLI